MPLATTKGALIWRTAGGDNSRSGRFAQRVQPATKPRLQLRATAAVQASVVFGSTDTAFVADMAGTLLAFAPDGGLRWRVSLPAGVAASPALSPDDQTLFAGTLAGTVHAVEAATGRLRWEHSIPTTSDPRILSDLLWWAAADSVVCSSWGGQFHALTSTSGTTKRTWDAGRAPAAAAATDSTGHCFCLRAASENGVQLLRISPDGTESVLHTEAASEDWIRRVPVVAAPVLDAERARVYALINRERGAALLCWSLPANRLLWSQSLPHCSTATPTLLADGSIAVADLAGTLHALDPLEGAVRWQYTAGVDYFLAGPVADDAGTIWIGDPLGRVHEVQPTGQGRILFEAARSLQARPSFSPSGHLHVPGTDGTVRVF